MMRLIPTYNIIFHAFPSNFYSMHPHVTNSMDQSPSCETRRSSASQEIPHIFLEPEVSLLHSQGSATCHYPEPGQSISYFSIPLLEDPFLNINLPSTSRSSKQFPSLRFPHSNPVCTSPLSLSHACYKYRGADKSLARPGRKQATEDSDFHISYL